MFSFGLKFSILIFLSIGFLAKPVIANDIFTAQRLLTELGYAPGPIDGAYGGKTKKAFIKLYTDQNMAFDGVVDKNELDLLKNLIAKINRPMPKRPVGINAKKAGKKKALPLLKALITREISAVELSDYDLCTSLMYTDFVDTYMEMKKRNLDCLYISQKQSGWKPVDRNKAFKYLRQYQKIYNVEIPYYNLVKKTKPFGTAAETAAIYSLLNPSFQDQVSNKEFPDRLVKKDFCFDWFAQVSYISDSQSKNIDGSQSWLEDSLRDGFVICQDTFNASYLSALFNENDLLGVKNVLETWINNDAPRRDVETNQVNFGYVLLINKAFAGLEMLREEFDWSDEFNLKFNEWVNVRTLELFPTDKAGRHVTKYCSQNPTNSSQVNEACKNGGMLRAQALLRAGIFTNNEEFVEMAYVAFHRFMSGVRKDGSVALDSIRGCTAANYNIWATQFMSDFHNLWMQIGKPQWDFRVKDYASVKETIEYSINLREDFEKINKYTWEDQWQSCGEMRKNRVQTASVDGIDFYPNETFGSYFFTFKPDIADQFLGNTGGDASFYRYTTQSGSNYEVSHLYTHPELIYKFSEINLGVTNKKLDIQNIKKDQEVGRDRLKEIVEKAKEEKLKIELVNKQIKEIVPVSFGSVYADVSKRDGNYQQVFFSLKKLSVGGQSYSNRSSRYEFILMIDHAPVSLSRGLTYFLRIQVSNNDMIPESEVANLENCKDILWKKTNNDTKLHFLIGNEAELNPCMLQYVQPEKRNFLGSIANALPEILEAGLAKKPEQLDAIMVLLNDARQREK
ncbi:peptidoglycan-binding protein [Amylibacter sp.]|nr:peptidoglycan-binding protein [Amylibacter sp.]MDA9304371.1 peptidoglycan-binding protein [Amylibacter sp.]